MLTLPSPIKPFPTNAPKAHVSGHQDVLVPLTQEQIDASLKIYANTLRHKGVGLTDAVKLVQTRMDKYAAQNAPTPPMTVQQPIIKQSIKPSQALTLEELVERIPPGLLDENTISPISKKSTETLSNEPQATPKASRRWGVKLGRSFGALAQKLVPASVAQSLPGLNQASKAVQTQWQQRPGYLHTSPYVKGVQGAWRVINPPKAPKNSGFESFVPTTIKNTETFSSIQPTQQVDPIIPANLTKAHRRQMILAMTNAGYSFKDIKQALSNGKTAQQGFALLQTPKLLNTLTHASNMLQPQSLSSVKRALGGQDSDIATLKMSELKKKETHQLAAINTAIQAEKARLQGK
jgi:DNA-binding transcriptional MerR regulator